MTTGATVADVLTAAARRLRGSGVAQPRIDAGVLLGHVLGATRAALIVDPDRPLNLAEGQRFAALVARRVAREPVSHITGEREFWGLGFRVTPTVLDPRPDSETVIEAALDALGDRTRAWRVLDLGTGSGCLLLVMLHELPNAFGIGVEISAQALSVCRQNAERLGVARRAGFLRGSWGAALAGQFDLILANPPYIVDADFADLEPEVARYEPRIALAGGADGLDAYRALAADLRRLLAPGGSAVIEVGAGQMRVVRDILTTAGASPIRVRRDLAGVERCLVLHRVTKN